MLSIMCASQPCQPGHFATPIIASSGRAPNFALGPSAWRVHMVTRSRSRQSARTTRRWARPASWQSSAADAGAGQIYRANKLGGAGPAGAATPVSAESAEERAHVADEQVGCFHGGEM